MATTLIWQPPLYGKQVEDEELEEALIAIEDAQLARGSITLACSDHIRALLPY